jgi:hypothetical protein
MVEIDEEGNRTISWPGSEFMQADREHIEANPALERLYLLIGSEPSRRWLSFAAEVLEMVQDREIEAVIMLGSMLADVPHTRPMPIFKSSQNEAFRSRFDLEPSTYEGPVGILSILSQAFEAEGIPVLSLWGSVPHYVHNTSNPKAALGFLGELTTLIGINFDTTTLAEQAFEWERSIDDVAEGDEEMTTYVSQLESNRDQLESEQASGDALAREFERYLNERKDGAGEG